MDIAPDAPALDPLRDRIQIIRGDITLMDDVVEALTLSKPDRVLTSRTPWVRPSATPTPRCG